MTDRKTNAEILAELDNCENAVTRSVLKDVCVSRLRDIVEGGGWQPIETAPKDGTLILISGGTYSCDEAMLEISSSKLNGVVCAEWCSIGSRFECLNDVNLWYRPTHWMPLPEPPE